MTKRLSMEMMTKRDNPRMRKTRWYDDEDEKNEMIRRRGWEKRDDTMMRMTLNDWTTRNNNNNNSRTTTDCTNMLMTTWRHTIIIIKAVSTTHCSLLRSTTKKNKNTQTHCSGPNKKKTRLKISMSLNPFWFLLRTLFELMMKTWTDFLTWFSYDKKEICCFSNTYWGLSELLHDLHITCPMGRESPMMKMT